MEKTNSKTKFTGTKRYRLLSCLGKGGMGVVYLAFDNDRQEEVALKTLQRLEPQHLLLFKREFRALADVTHENLVSLYEMSAVGDVWFFTMELVRGHNFLEHIWGGATVSETETLSEDMAAAPEIGRAVLHSPMARVVDIERLRSCMVQVVRGLSALHAAGSLHRDIKPSNILVWPEGRVVILDFGLVTEIQGGDDTECRSPLRGTISYMAPELFDGERGSATPACDWYSLGVVLYQALTGSLPFPGIRQTASREQRQSPLPPSQVTEGVPASLEKLCLDLLQVDPAKRPTSDEILFRLGDPASVSSRFFRERQESSSFFVGRNRELGQLQSALDRVEKAAGAGVVWIHGVSGMGKTTLVRHFLSEARRDRNIIAFEGRCYDRESVPYKAVDSLVDSIFAYLSGLPPASLEKLLPPDFFLLADLFPVLRRLSATTSVEKLSIEGQDSLKKRLRAFGAFRSFLVNLSVDSIVVFFLDDLQWSDLDSAALLSEVLCDPNAPKVLVIGARRAGASFVPDPILEAFLSTDASARLPVPQTIDLPPLPNVDATRLAHFLLRRRGQERVQEIAASIADAAEGLPFFVRELARDISEAPTEVDLPPVELLKQLLNSRIATLDHVAKKLLEVATLCGKPVRSSVAADAAGIADQERAALSQLRALSLVVSWGGPDDSSLEVAHDRIRVVASESMSPDRIRTLHRDIAYALERAGGDDVDALLDHFQAAGVTDQARSYAQLAAEKADRALAFERAAELFQRAADLHGEAENQTPLIAKAATALANAGQFRRAGAKFLEAATRGREFISARHYRKFRRLASEQYMKNGDIEKGWDLMKDVLREIGIPIPSSQTGALAYSIWRRIVFLVRGLKTIDSKREPSLEMEERLEVLWTASTSFAMVNVTLSDAFRGRHLLDALKFGGPSTVCRALAFEVAMEATIGGKFFDRNCRRLMTAVEKIVVVTGDPYDRGWASLAGTVVATATGSLKEAVELGAATERFFAEKCQGAYWERSTAIAFFHEALAWRGNLKELAVSQTRFLDETKQGMASYGVLEAYTVRDIFLSWIAVDDPEKAYGIAAGLLAQQTETQAAWPVGGYRAQQAYLFAALVHKEIYRGRPAQAWEAVLQSWPGLRKSFLLSLRVFNIHLPFMRGRAAIALAAQNRSENDLKNGGWSTKRLLGDVRKIAGRLKKNSHPAANPFASLLLAGEASVTENSESARTFLAAALAGFDEAGMDVYREVARYALGLLLPEGDARMQSLTLAEDRLAAQGVKRVAAFVYTLCPGVGRPLQEHVHGLS